MHKSEAINELADALAKAQGQMGGAKKDSDNPFFKSKYADLASVVEAIRGPFAEHGLAYVQLPVPTEQQTVSIRTVLMHRSGQWIMSETEVPVTKADAQGYGSALTYARRYGLQAMAGIAAEDDDGNAAVKSAPPPTTSELRIQRTEAHPEDQLFREVATGLAEQAELAAEGRAQKLISQCLLRKQELKLTAKAFADYKRKHLGHEDLYKGTEPQLDALLGELNWARRLSEDRP